MLIRVEGTVGCQRGFLVPLCLIIFFDTVISRKKRNLSWSVIFPSQHVSEKHQTFGAVLLERGERSDYFNWVLMPPDLPEWLVWKCSASYPKPVDLAFTFLKGFFFFNPFYPSESWNRPKVKICGPCCHEEGLGLLRRAAFPSVSLSGSRGIFGGTPTSSSFPRPEGAVHIIPKLEP